MLRKFNRGCITRIEDDIISNSITSKNSERCHKFRSNFTELVMKFYIDIGKKKAYFSSALFCRRKIISYILRKLHYVLCV